MYNNSLSLHREHIDWQHRLIKESGARKGYLEKAYGDKVWLQAKGNAED
jgi:hypothetical protein